MQIKHFFDQETSTFTYIVWDEQTKDAVIIDPVLNFDPVNLSFSETSISQLLQFLQENNLNVQHVLETHIHADHITGAARLREKLGVKLVVSSRVTTVQETFRELLAIDDDSLNKDVFDVYLDDGEILKTGSLKVKAIHTPGHTPACVTYQIEDALFVGDTIFMPDFGTGRCDFPKGSADVLFDSITKKLYTFPDETRVFVAHDYQPGGRELLFETTIGACKTENKHLKVDTKREDFLKYRTERDRTLSLPKLIFQSVQLNVRGGALPKPAANGLPMLRIPILGA